MGTDSHLSRDWGLAATRVPALFGSSCASFVTYRLWHSYCVPICPWELKQGNYTLSVGHNQEGPLAPGWQEKTLLTCPTQLKSWYSSILPFFEVYSRKKLYSDAILLNTPKFFILCLWFFVIVLLSCHPEMQQWPIFQNIRTRWSKNIFNSFKSFKRTGLFSGTSEHPSQPGFPWPPPGST